MNLIHAFKDSILRTKRNGQTVRGKWEIEWQSTDQSQKANTFLREIISYKVNYNKLGFIRANQCLGGS